MSYAYGNSCRSCSDWECPIGQYRTTCTPHSDSYCKQCTNAPNDKVYVTPGNNNDCEYGEQDPNNVNDFPDGSTSDVDPAIILVYFELPVTEVTFNTIGSPFRLAIASVAAVGDVDKVKVISIKEYDMADVNDPAQSSTSSSPPPPPPPAPSPAESVSNGGCGVCGTCVPGDRQAAADGCDFNVFNQCCDRRRSDAVLQHTTAGRHLLQEAGCTELPASGDKKFIVVEIEVATTIGKIDDTWNKLNEYDVNRKMASSCLPPAVMSYDNVIVNNEEDDGGIFMEDVGGVGPWIFVLLGIPITVVCYWSKWRHQKQQRLIAISVSRRHQEMLAQNSTEPAGAPPPGYDSNAAAGFSPNAPAPLYNLPASSNPEAVPIPSAAFCSYCGVPQQGNFCGNCGK